MSKVRKQRAPSPQTLRVLVHLMSNTDTWVHGFEIMKATGISSSVVYPVLSRLLERGVLESKIDDSNPLKPKKEYRFTDKGKAFAQKNLEKTIENLGASSKKRSKATSKQPQVVYT